MAWTAPRTYTAGEIITASILNSAVRDNLRYLKGLDGAVTLSDALILPDGAGYYVHIPGLTTTQRDALTPTAGMVIYNTTTTQFNKYENGAWRADLGFNSAHTNLSGLTNDDHTQYLLESLLTTQGDLPYATAASTWARLAKGAAYQLLRMNSGATAPEWGSSSTSVTVRKTADETVVNSAVLQNDDHLLVAVNANTSYALTVCLRYYYGSPSSAGTDIAWSIPAAGAMYEISAWRSETASLINATAELTLDGGGATDFAYLTQYLYIGGANAGTLQLQWAQNTQHNTANTIYANSFIIMHNLG